MPGGGGIQVGQGMVVQKNNFVRSAVLGLLLLS